MQLAREIEESGKERRQALIDSIFKKGTAIRVTFSPKQSLAMKTDLQIPWNKVHTMRR